MQPIFSLISKYQDEGKFPPVIAETLKNFATTYVAAAEKTGSDRKLLEASLSKLITMIVEQIDNPFSFEAYHERIRSPFDYYQFGLDFIRPIVMLNESRVVHPENLEKIQKQLNQGDNIILLANHQTELDPQAISLLLEKSHPKLAEEMIFIAGHRVISDHLAVPFSKGRNLLCIFSKKYIEDNPDTKQEKLMHNQRTMKLMSQLLSQGGKCIYVAPSGGRDRPNKKGVVEVAPFDPQSIEMLFLMAQCADHPTHFYPLAMATYNLLPPPDNVKKKLGEARHTNATPIHIAFGPEIDMASLPGRELKDKHQKRKMRAQHIWEQVCRDYKLIG